jgi:hypothetical protein
MYVLNFKYTYSINEENVLYNYLHRKHKNERISNNTIQFYND